MINKNKINIFVVIPITPKKCYVISKQPHRYEQNKKSPHILKEIIQVENFIFSTRKKNPLTTKLFFMNVHRKFCCD